MDAIITALAPTFGTEALKLWGSYAFCLIVLGLTLWRSESRTKDKSTEIKELKAENKALGDRLAQLQDQRLEDVRKMIPVIESSTQTAAARAQSDTVFLDGFQRALSAVVDRLEALEERLPEANSLPPRPVRPPSRRPR